MRRSYYTRPCETLPDGGTITCYVASDFKNLNEKLEAGGWTRLTHKEMSRTLTTDFRRELENSESGIEFERWLTRKCYTFRPTGRRLRT